MFSFLKKRNWQEGKTSFIGTNDNVRVHFEDFPILKDEESGKKKEFYPDFNGAFLEDLTKQIGDYDDIKDKTGSSLNYQVNLNKAPAFSVRVEIMGQSKNDREFFNDLANAIIAGFESQDIGR